MPATDAPILVTGATGFVASRIVEQLLSMGRRVRGTVRSLSKNRDHLSPLRALPGFSGNAFWLGAYWCATVKLVVAVPVAEPPVTWALTVTLSPELLGVDPTRPP